MAVDNSTILTRAWLSGTNDFQQRIPNPTQGDIKASIDALFDPTNRNYYNMFVDSLICRIGATYVHQHTWRNPLAVFKKGRLDYGLAIEEIAVKWIKAHSYIDDAEDVFKMHRPDAATWFHQQNRQDMYPITVVQNELRTAFTSADDGLNKFIAACLDAPMNSDNYDEYRIMMQLIAFYENTWGFYKHQLSAAPTTQATGEEFLVELRAYAGQLKFPSTLYNSGVIDDVPVFANPEELVILMTPRTKANIDVRNLAAAFNRSDEEIQQRIVLVDEFPIPDAVALLTTEDFFQCRDTLYQNEGIYNPKTLGNNYFLHHWGVYSVSPFVPAILFTTGSGTSIPTITMAATGISATPSKASVDVINGDTVQITCELTGTLTQGANPYGGTKIKVAPDACTYNVMLMGGEPQVFKPMVDTVYVDRNGILHVPPYQEPLNADFGPFYPAAGDVLIVECSSAYVNPSDTTEFMADSFSIECVDPSA